MSAEGATSSSCGGDHAVSLRCEIMQAKYTLTSRDAYVNEQATRDLV